MRACPRLRLKGACACGLLQVSNIRLGPSLQIELERQMRTSVWISVFALFMSGCSVYREPTPEPEEKARIDKLFSRLGTTERKTNTGLILVEGLPETRLLARWLGRRQRTKSGEVGPDELPARQNPGTIEETLKWERMSPNASILLVIMTCPPIIVRRRSSFSLRIVALCLHSASSSMFPS